jgi:hypothetical protein
MTAQPSHQRGRREFLAIVIAGLMLQVLIGAVATVGGTSVAWGSLVHRPLLLIALGIAAYATRIGYPLLIAWCSYLAITYMYGGFIASYPLLTSMRWTAGIFFGFSAFRLTTTGHMRAYLSQVNPGR